MAGRPQQLDLFADAARLREHLVRCGFSIVQAALAALVLERGERRRVGTEMRSVLSIAGADAGRRLGCTRQAVGKAATVLQRHEWFAVLQDGVTVYVLDDAGARSELPLDERLSERLEALASEPPPSVRGDSPPDIKPQVQPPATGCNRVQPGATASRVSERFKQNPCLPCPSTSPRLSPRRLPAVAPGCRRLPSEVPYPWMKDRGITDVELRAAVQTENLELLAWMHDVAVGLGWIRGQKAAEQPASDGSWFRFLVCAHHTASARGIPAGKRMACLVTRGKQQFGTTHTQQRSDQWAGRMLSLRWRDTALMALGRATNGRDED